MWETNNREKKRRDETSITSDGLQDAKVRILLSLTALRIIAEDEVRIRRDREGRADSRRGSLGFGLA
jgi:hypothetical protein